MHDVAGFCPACGHPTLYVGAGGHLVCSLMDCPKPEAADQLLHGDAPGPEETDTTQPVVTVHAAPNLSPAAEEALGALVNVAKQWASCDFEHPHPEHPCGRRVPQPHAAPVSRADEDGAASAPKPFFEVGKVYESKNGPRWEIRFQREGIAHFHPVRVDRDSTGLLHAYGKLSLDDDHMWTTMGRHEFGAWELADRTHYPYRDGDVTVLGPEVFASSDRTTISWRGAVYVLQDFPAPTGGPVPSTDRPTPEERTRLATWKQRQEATERSAPTAVHSCGQTPHTMDCVTTLAAAESAPAATEATDGWTQNEDGTWTWTWTAPKDGNVTGFHLCSHCPHDDTATAPAATEAAGRPDTITDPAWLREQYAAVIRRWWDADDGGAEEIADAVMRVRDRHLQQLRQRLALADSLHQKQLDGKEQPGA
ncbi:DUF6085 family protein [Streptomyces hygroscopicus]|uniref:DUF6085 family protein n=1 Tax=Streptomyces hygroscopicus TaxID=1912 RepID=UPI00224019A0|nr:DUF6085 family protein [Streptomyces hygroscopicus]